MKIEISLPTMHDVAPTAKHHHENLIFTMEGLGPLVSLYKEEVDVDSSGEETGNLRSFLGEVLIDDLQQMVKTLSRYRE